MGAVTPFRAYFINLKYLGVLILDTGFRFLLALNGRNFGTNAHLAALSKGPKPEGARFRWFLVALLVLPIGP